MVVVLIWEESGAFPGFFFSAAYSTALYTLRHEVYYTTYRHKWLCYTAPNPVLALPLTCVLHSLA